MEVTIRDKPAPDFNYMDVPFEPTSSFYPDRIFRDEMAAREQFFNSPDFRASDAGQMIYANTGRDLDVAKDDFINFINDYDLKLREERPGGVLDYDPRVYNYADNLYRARQNQFAKYNPKFGMSDAGLEALEPPTSMFYGYPYGEETGMPDNLSDYMSDVSKEATRSFLGSGAFVGDTLFNLASNFIYPFDTESMTGGVLPRGYLDIINYTNEMGAFHNQLLSQGIMPPAPDQWESLGYSEKKDISDEFKRLTGSKYDYDPTYQPISGGVLQDLVEPLAEGMLMPESSYEDIEGIPVVDPLFTQQTYNLNPVEIAEITGELPFLKLPSGLKFAKAGIAKYAPTLIKKYPKIAAALGLSVPTITEFAFEE